MLAGQNAFISAALLLLTASAGAQAAAADEPAAGATHVYLPLPEYERLRKADEKTSVTVIDTLRVSGSFKGGDLSLSLTGRSAGKMPAQAVLSGTGGIHLYGCEGDAILSRSDSGAFELLPQAPRFTVRCHLAATGSDRLQLTPPPGVLWTESQVKDGEYVAGEDSGKGRSFSIVRIIDRGGAAAETVPPAATARYRLSLQPEETRFRYQFDVRNPNRSHQPFVLQLQSGEHVQQVDAQASYEAEGMKYRFNLPPGEMSLVLSGTLSESRFTPPLQASVQYLLMESHPLLRPTVEGSVKRISAGETGVVAQFRGAQGFLLSDRESLRWKVTRLEALRTTSFAVRSVHHIFFLSADGKAPGESRIVLDNQGAPDLSLPMRAEPTFASLQGEPVFLTRNEAGDLWLPLSQGEQVVVVQHRQSMTQALGWATATLWLPQLLAPASTAHVELRYPHEWLPVYEELAPEHSLPIFTGEEAFWLLFLLLLTERALYCLGQGPRRRLVLALGFSLGAVAAPLLFLLVVLGDLMVLVLWPIPFLRRVRWSFFRVMAVLVPVGGLLFLLLVAGVATRSMAPSASGVDTMVFESKKAMSRMEEGRPASVDKPAAVAPEPQGPGGQAYQGLPAKFDMPGGERHKAFYRELLSTERPRAVRVVLLSQRAVSAMRAQLLLLALLVLLGLRKSLGLGWRALLRRAGITPAVQPPPVPPTL